MNTVNSAFQEVLFSYTFDALMTSIHAESAYVAVSVGSAVPSADKPLSAIIITDDEASFVRAALSKAHTAMLTRLSAYLANQPAADEDVYAFARVYLGEWVVCVFSNAEETRHVTLTLPESARLQNLTPLFGNQVDIQDNVVNVTLQPLQFEIIK